MPAFRWAADFRMDVEYAWRTLRRAPGFAVVVLLTLAVGIGANTAIFTAIRSVLLAPLPYPQSDQLIRVWENVPGREIGDGKGPDRRYPAMDVGDLIEASARAKTITRIANYGPAQAVATVGRDTTKLEGVSVSGDLFPLVGVAPLRGRPIQPDDATAGHDHVVVLGYDAWMRFGGGEIIGTPLTFAVDPGGVFTGGIAGGVPYTIVGVMPAGFRFPNDAAQFWIPRVQRPSPDGRPIRRETIARLAKGSSPQAAAAELAAIRAAARGTPAANAGPPRYELVRLHEEITGPVRPALVVLLLAVGAVLLIACVNVANLLLARGLARRRELAVRSAIGAARSRLARQLLAESVMLSTLGGTAGVALALAGVRAFRTLGTTLSRSDLGNRIVFPRLAEVRIDTVVLAYAAMLSIAAGIVFGLIPALRYSREGMTDALRESTTSARSRMKAVLVVAELALATLLLVSGGLLINSFARLATTDPGFDPSHVLTFQVSTSRPVEQLAFAEALTARLQSVPGITSAAYGRQLPMVNLQDSLRLTIRRNGVDETVDDSPDVRFVSRDYLKTLGVPVLAGRGLSEQDGSGGSPVIVVNESLARRDLRGVNPIGQMIVLGPPARRVAFEIVGVAGDVRQFALDRPAGSQYFIDTRQVPTDPAVRMPPLLPVGPYFLIRTANDPVTMAANIRDIAAQLSPGATLDHVATMDQIVSNSMTRPRMYAVLVSVFCGIAAVLAGVGLYGVVAYAVTQRTKEIGVRVALGAARRDVLVLILRDGMLLIGIGLAFGLASAAIVTRYMRDLLFGLTPLDPATFASVAAFVAAIAAVASYVPARRATSVDPLVALRHD